MSPRFQNDAKRSEIAYKTSCCWSALEDPGGFLGSHEPPSRLPCLITV